MPEDTKTTINRFHLNAEDLSVLQWATHFTSDDPQRPVLQGICLDRGGRVVATDGHRLLLRQVAGLQGVTMPVLVGPVTTSDIPAGAQAVLSVGEEARLIVSGEEERTIPILDGPYVAYEKVIPPLGPTCVYLDVGALGEALDAMADQLEGRHPVQDGRRYTPLVELRLAGAEQTLTLLTTDRIGYSAVEGGQAAAVPAAVSWTFSVVIEARIEPEDAVFCSRVNYRYLRQVVAALALHNGEELMLSLSAPDKVIMCMPAKRPNEKALLMPCRMEADAA